MESGRYAAYEFWNDTFFPNFSESLTFELAPSSCRVLCIRPFVDRPDVISTSRHLTQGGVDLVSLEWDESKKQLRGVSRLIANDPYELRIAAPESAPVSRVHSVQFEGCEVSTVDDIDLVLTRITSPKTGTVPWTVTFE